MNFLDITHWEEWQNSAVASEIVNANAQSLSSQDALEAVLYAAIDQVGGHGKQYATAEVSRLFNHYSHVSEGGWWCAGLEFSKDGKGSWQQQRMQWGCFKPNRPRLDLEKGRPIKYEHPVKTSTRAFFLEVPSKPRLWLEALADPNIPIIIVEGAKKAGCLLTLGYIAIALPGITGAVRTRDSQGNECAPYLIPEIQQFAVAGRDIYLLFDHDRKFSTIAAVNRELSKLGKLLSKVGCNVRIINLPGPEKGVDDFVVAKGEGAFHELYQRAIAFDDWQVEELFNLTHPANRTINQRYLGDLQVPDNAKLICMKSLKGSGKTHSLEPLVQEAISAGRWVLIIGHRVQLVQELCNRLGVNYVTEIRDSEVGRILGFGLCIDSLHPASQAQFSATGWRDGLVILDEAEQVLWHVLNSSTCQKHRVSILNELRQLLVNVLHSSRGQVVLSDADLSDVSIDCVRKLAEIDVEPWVIINEWKTDRPWKIYHYKQTSPANWLVALEKEIESGGRPFICLSAQQAKSTWGTQSLESRLGERFPDKKILRIDSKTIADRSHEAFGCVSTLNATLRSYDIVVASPSIETGVSIDLEDHFTSVWGCFQGVQSENSVRQALARVRGSVDRHVWIAPTGIGQIGGGGTSVRALLKAEHQKIKANIRLLEEADLTAIDTTFDRAALLTWAKIACRVNHGMKSYRASVIKGLATEGHDIIDVEEVANSAEKTKHEMKQLCEVNKHLEAEAICAADLLETAEYEKLKQQRGQTRNELAAIERYELEGRYCVPLTPDLVIKDRQGWYSQLRLHYYLTAGRPYLKSRDAQRLSKLIHNGKLWIPDGNRSQLSTPIAILEWLNVAQLLNPELDFRGSDLEGMAEQAIAHRWEVRAALGVAIKATDQPMLIAQKLLGKLGLKLKLRSRDRTPEGKAGARVYRLVSEDDGRAEIFQRWLERDQKLTSASLGKDSDMADPGSVSIDISPPLDQPDPGSSTSTAKAPNAEDVSAQTSGPCSREPIADPWEGEVIEAELEDDALAPGALCQWTHHIGMWQVIEVVDKQIAKVRSIAGWNQNIPFAAKIDDLVVIHKAA